MLPWLVSYAAGQITRGQIGADGLTPHQRLKGRAFRKLLLVFGESVLYIPIGKRASRLLERWSDGLFLGVVERVFGSLCWHRAWCRASSKSETEALEERANVELLGKLVCVPWQLVLGEPDSSAVPTVILAEPIAEGEALPDRADVIAGAARRTCLRKNVELKRYGFTAGCPGAACRTRIEEAMAGVR